MPGALLCRREQQRATTGLRARSGGRADEACGKGPAGGAAGVVQWVLPPSPGATTRLGRRLSALAWGSARLHKAVSGLSDTAGAPGPRARRGAEATAARNKQRAAAPPTGGRPCGWARRQAGGRRAAGECWRGALGVRAGGLAPRRASGPRWGAGALGIWHLGAAIWALRRHGREGNPRPPAWVVAWGGLCAAPIGKASSLRFMCNVQRRARRNARSCLPAAPSLSFARPCEAVLAPSSQGSAETRPPSIKKCPSPVAPRLAPRHSSTSP